MYKLVKKICLEKLNLTNIPKNSKGLLKEKNTEKNQKLKKK